MYPLFYLRLGRVEQIAIRFARMMERRRSQSIGDRPHEAARILRRRAIAPGRPRTFMIRPVVP
jgi:hypothetical protein